MSNENFLRLFTEMRLSPWLPEHDKYIRSRLAALEVEDPKGADTYRLKYAKIHAGYLAAHPEEAIAPLPEEVKEHITKKTKVTVTTDKPKKTKKKS